ncbi:MAG TPA: histidine phosphatase family protein [Streptosporangiaceae bacterium]|nr:histidine phosphatase family protein [Streptosporangiaceae bacterium]
MAAERRLIIMRHAKAGELPGGPDFERALRPRGRRNAQSAGAWLASRSLTPELVLCSKARRARQTWQYVSEELSGEPEVIMDERLYDADVGDLLGIFAHTQASVNTLMYVGHNPAAAEVAEVLTVGPVEFPTSAVAVIGVAGPWPELAGGSGELIAHWTPHEEGG